MHNKKKSTNVKYSMLRKAALTPIDLCFQKGIIPRDSYNAACFFSRLYMIRFGQQLRMSSSYDSCLAKLCIFPPSGNLSQEQHAWFNRTYLQIHDKLVQLKAYEIVRDICIFEHIPNFLKIMPAQLRSNSDALLEYILLKNGLNEISVFLYRKKLCPN